MSILILGKNGMLGHDLQRVFDHEDFMALGVKELDVTDREKVFQKFITLQPTVVINATGYTDVDMAEKEEEKAKAVNGYAVGVLAQACREIDATLIQFSSDYVFNGQKTSGYTESDVTSPINAYGRSKELGEKLLIEEMEMRKSDMEPEGKYFLIRTSWLFGKHGKNFVDTMLSAAKGKNELKVVNDQHGKPTFTMDLARQVKWLLESMEYPSGIYHVTNEEETTWFDFAKAIFDLKKTRVRMVPCTSREFTRPARRPAYSTLVNTKLPPLRPWKEALQEYIQTL
jgi:dTDP-4-dehydrorhamnose reductase